MIRKPKRTTGPKAPDRLAPALAARDREWQRAMARREAAWQEAAQDAIAARDAQWQDILGEVVSKRDGEWRAALPEHDAAVAEQASRAVEAAWSQPGMDPVHVRPTSPDAPIPQGIVVQRGRAVQS